MESKDIDALKLQLKVTHDDKARDIHIVFTNHMQNTENLLKVAKDRGLEIKSHKYQEEVVDDKKEKFKKLE